MRCQWKKGIPDMAMRPETPLRLNSNLDRGRPVQITVDGEPIQAYEGESLAAALMAAGRRTFRHLEPGGHPRGIFCGMGICYDCLVTVAGQDHVRACMTLVQPGMQVTTLRE
jgi:predicted molibdopterin-dependent oxidoreductase YjgC